MNRLIPILRLLILTIVFGALLFSSSPGPIVASGSIKLWSGIHLGNRPGADWNSTLLADIDGDRPGGTWPKAVVFLSSQLYYLSRDADCRIKKGPNDTITNRPVLLDYLQRASQSGVRIIIRIHPSPGNFDTDHNLWVGPIPGIGYCDWDDYRPADDIADEMTAIHNYNQAHGITEWGFEPANEPNAEWYPWDSPLEWPKPYNAKAWQHMNEYFKAVWLSAPTSVHALTPPMAQGLFAETKNVNAINDPDPSKWCPDMPLDNGSTGYDVMRQVYETYNDGIDWHNYWRLGWENSGDCRAHAQHVAFFFPWWMKNLLELGYKPGTITEADLFSYGQPPNQDPNQPLHNKDDAYGWPAANSLRKFFQKEARAQALVAWLLNDNVNHPDQDHNWHEAYNDETGDSRRIWFAKWWQYFERWASPWFLPDIRKDFNGWNSTIVIRNNSSDTAQVYVDLYDQNGMLRASEPYFPPGNGIVEVIPPVPSNFFGSAIVYSERDVSVVVKQRHNNKTYAYSGLPDSSGFGFSPGTPIYLPISLDAYYGWYSHATVQNAGNNTATVLAEYYNSSGVIDWSEVNDIPPAASAEFDSPAGITTSAMKLTSTKGQPIVATATQYNAPYIHQSTMTSSYIGFSAGGYDVYLPGLYKNYYGWTSSFRLQNLSSSTAWVTIRYYDEEGRNPLTYWYWGIGSQGWLEFYQGNEDPEIPSFIRSAWIHSTQPIVAVANQENSSDPDRPDHQSYSGFIGGVQAIYLPLVQQNYNGWVTGISVQNTSENWAHVTIDFYHANGDFAGSTSPGDWIAPRASKVFYNEIPNGLNGSAVVTADQDVVAIVNQNNYGISDGALSYSGLD